MDRNLDLRIEIDEENNFKIVSYEPESGTQYLVCADNLNRMNIYDQCWKIGNEILSWIQLWADEAKKEEK